MARTLPADDRPVPVTTVVEAANTNGACTCSGVHGERTVHTIGQPGCHNG
jgi:hypothetical protein